MYARITTFDFQPGNEDRVEELGRKYEQVLHDLPGHRSTVMMLRGATLVSLTTWDTQEHAQAATPAARGPAARELGVLLTGEPTTTIARALVHDLRD